MTVPVAYMHARWERVWKGMSEAGVDTLIVAGRAGIGEYGALHYLTGHYPIPRVALAVVRLGEAPSLLLRSEAELRALELEAETPVRAVQLEREGDDYHKAVGQFVSELRADRIGIVRGDLLNASAFAEMNRAAGERLIDCTPTFDRIRAGKTHDDLGQFRATAAVAEEGLRYAARHARPGQSEEEIAGAIEAVLRARGAQMMLVFASKDAFFGQRPTARKVTARDTLCILVELCGRTGHWVELGIALAMPEAGEGSTTAQVCTRALQHAASRLGCGTEFSDIALAIEATVDSAGFQPTINLGHCVGVDEERPGVHRDSRQRLAATAAIALHPSAGTAIGAEGAVVANTYLVLPEGVEALSAMPERLHYA